VRGKLTKKSIAFAVIYPMTMMKEKVQSLQIDVMHVDGNKFLVTTVEPLQLTIWINKICEREQRRGHPSCSTTVLNFEGVSKRF
jgi:hypothetical protein